MPFRSVINPSEVAMLTRVFNQHCNSYGIRGEESRESVAASLISHFQRGMTNETKLLEALADEDAPDNIRSWEQAGKRRPSSEPGRKTAGSAEAP